MMIFRLLLSTTYSPTPPKYLSNAARYRIQISPGALRIYSMTFWFSNFLYEKIAQTNRCTLLAFAKNAKSYQGQKPLLAEICDMRSKYVHRRLLVKPDDIHLIQSICTEYYATFSAFVATASAKPALRLLSTGKRNLTLHRTPSNRRTANHDL